jgi:hypothetical protein
MSRRSPQPHAAVRTLASSRATRPMTVVDAGPWVGRSFARGDHHPDTTWSRRAGSRPPSGGGRPPLPGGAEPWTRMVTERLAERTPETTYQLVELGRSLSTFKGPNKVGPHDLKRDDSVSTAGTALSIGLVNVVRLVWAEPLPDRCRRLIDQYLGYIRHITPPDVCESRQSQTRQTDTASTRGGLRVPSVCFALLLHTSHFPSVFRTARRWTAPRLTLYDAPAPSS